jgi:WD40 repeat protein
MLLVAVMAGLLFAAWYFAAREPLLRAPNSPWRPLAFTRDGTSLAAVHNVSSLISGSYIRPFERVHLLRSIDLVETEPALELPQVKWGVGLSSPAAIEHIEFSPDGRTIAVIQHHRDGISNDTLEMFIIDRASREFERSFVLEQTNTRTGGIARQLFSADGRFLAWHDFDAFERPLPHAVHVWDRREKRERLVVEHAVCPSMSPDSRRLAVIDQSAEDVRLYDLETGRCMHTLRLAGHTVGIRQWPEFSPDSRFVALFSHGVNGLVSQIFDVESGRLVFETDSSSPQFLDDGRTLVTIHPDLMSESQFVEFRNVADWSLRSQTEFRVGKDLDLKRGIAPVPGRSAVIVHHSDRVTNAWLATAHC